MNTRSPRVAFAAPIMASSAAGSAAAYRSGRPDWMRSFMWSSRGGAPALLTVRTAWSPSTGMSSPEQICGPIPGGLSHSNARSCHGHSSTGHHGDLMVKRPPAGTIPEGPGSYQFKDEEGRVVYVGKAKSLRQRLNNYFGDPALLLPRTRQMVEAAESVEWIQVGN